MRRWRNLLFCLLTVVATITTAHADNSEGLQLFRDSVRADLIHHCLECHGGKSIKADFDLSTRERLMDSGFVAATAADSHLMALVRHEAEPEMPFRKPRLPEEVISRIARWIDLGAPYDKPLSEQSASTTEMHVTDEDRDFWSFRPLKRPTPPAPRNIDWCRNEIDQFILAQLEAQGLTPGHEADRRTLLRRATCNLTGLPPEFETVIEESAAHFSDSEWNDLISDLLDSPHYGERWARHWMDVARFAESHGYEQDYDRPHAYHYRDFLIRAFNADMPFDQFVRWQLAGDELAPDEPLAQMATGFLGAGVFPTQLTEAEFESTRYDELDDMTATTGVAFLGLSIGCARCHDHKFDPVPTRDYYRMAATFTRTIRTVIEIDCDPQANAGRRLAHERRDAELTAAIRRLEGDRIAGAFEDWLIAKHTAVAASPWQVIRPDSIEAVGQFVVQPDKSVLATGQQPDTDVIQVAFAAGERESPVHALRLEALSDTSLPRGGPGLASNGNIALGHITVSVDGQPIDIDRASATHQQNKNSLSIAASLDSDPVSGWAVDHGGIGSDQAAVFYFSKPIHPNPDAKIVVRMTFRHPNKRHTIGRFRLSLSELSNPPVIVRDDTPSREVVEAIRVLRHNAVDDNARQVAFAWYCAQDEEWNRLQQELTEHRSAGPDLELTPVQVNSENVPLPEHHANGRGYPHFYAETHLLTRGDVSQKQDVIEPGFLQVLTADSPSEATWDVTRPPTATTGFDRARLAAWMTDPDNPSGQLVARVIVNRIWQHHFGRGLVATPSDFGFQGERPTHPELLEWLASDLIDHGWRLKRLHRLIMNSSTYRQSSEFRDSAHQVDPDNKLLWRYTPRRFEAEAIRDALLLVSGRLDRTMYGPGTLDESMERRSIYFQIKRSQLIPMMMLFDWPEHLVSIGRRSVTTTAPQALLFMNSPQGREFARGLARRLQRKAPVADAYRIVLGRRPSPEEQAVASEFLQKQTMIYRSDESVDADEEALTDFCQSLISLNEFIYVE